MITCVYDVNFGLEIAPTFVADLVPEEGLDNSLSTQPLKYHAATDTAPKRADFGRVVPSVPSTELLYAAAR